MAPANSPKHIDFYTCTAEEIKDFTYPLEFIAERTGLMHGVSRYASSLLITDCFMVRLGF